METLARIWEVIGVVFGGLLRSFERAVTSMFGSSNERYIRRLQSNVDEISALEPKFEAMSDEELRQQTELFRQRLKQGETLEDLLIDAFAACREGGKRYLGMRHYDVQLVGGMVLHSGAISEMVTGEGKTLVATLAAYLNALSGQGVHVVTVNDYLARRDMEWMGPLYLGLGLTVGTIQSDMPVDERQKAYDCDITYGTNNEFGFDYLRDNMRPAARGDDQFPKQQQQSQGRLHFAIVDEVDNILIDEARTPLIISGPAHDDVTKYSRADKLARQLKKEAHFTVSEKDHQVTLTDEGVREAERLAGVESFYTAGNMEWPHLIDNSLKAHYLYKRDVNYVVNEGHVVIVDEFTGRLMEGRQWSDGLHQSVEAKEGVKIKEETQTLATITLQNFFKLYNKICGMTGTAMTEAAEFWKIYGLDVIAIPTNRPMQRQENPDVIYCTEEEKYEAIADEIERVNRWDVLVENDSSEQWGKIIREDQDSLLFQPRDRKAKETVSVAKLRSVHRKGRPILVGTVSIEKSERLSHMLERRGIEHQVLNAKQHQREADIIAQAGRIGGVTIATNMAGRGTDIVLGGNPETMAWGSLQDKYETRLDVPRNEWDELVAQIETREKMPEEGQHVKDLGGLHVLATERHEARRIDLQLRGRCGRQGDPGSSRFYLSLEDDLMRIFAGEWVKKVLERLGMQRGEAIESPMVTRRIAAAQKKVEERNFEIRKNLLEYDEVMDEQRKRIYQYRQKILDGTNCKHLILKMIRDQVDEQLDQFLGRDYGVDTFTRLVGTRLSSDLDPRDFRGMDFDAARDYSIDEAERQAETQVLDQIEENLDQEMDPNDWNWEAVAKFANTRWKLNLRDRDLKKVGRGQVDEFLIDSARKALRKVDLSDTKVFLDPDFGLQNCCGWIAHKFDLKIDVQEVRELDREQFKQLVYDRAAARYNEKEYEYPIMAGIYRYTKRTSSGPRIDREGLVAWARERFQVQLEVDDLKTKQREEIQALLIDHSRKNQQCANEVLLAVKDQIDTVFQNIEDKGETTGQVADGNGALSSLSNWVQHNLEDYLPPDELASLQRDELEQKLCSIVEDRYRPEIRRMERHLVLQLVDTAWKDHLLTMDHLRSAVGLVGYAQVDPKIEYKREGMKLFDTMWQSLGERATDLIFRMEQLDEGFVGSTWVETEAKHEQAQSASELATQQQQAIDASQGDAKTEPIRNRGRRVGRNEPCPCGSGKKYKNCCLRKND